MNKFSCVITALDPFRPARNAREARRQRIEQRRWVTLACGHRAALHKTRAVIGSTEHCIDCDMDDFVTRKEP